jgi:putative endonuclease
VSEGRTTVAPLLRSGADRTHAQRTGATGATRIRVRGALGRTGEAIAASHLRGEGFELLARNVRTRAGEIDLVAFDGDTLVFAEVKTRQVRAPRLLDEHEPLLGLRPSQRARLRRLAAAWLRETENRPSARAIRFDAIGVILDRAGALRELRHVEGAF